MPIPQVFENDMGLGKVSTNGIQALLYSLLLTLVSTEAVVIS